MALKCKTKDAGEQFHQNLWSGQTGKEIQVYRYQKYFGNLKKYLPKRAGYVLSYKYISLLVDWLLATAILFYHKSVRRCFVGKNLLYLCGIWRFANA